VVGAREAAFDVVQETFSRALVHIGSLRDDSKFGSWLFGIAHQACLRQFRSWKRDDAVFDTEAEPTDHAAGADHPLSLLLSSEDAGRLYELVDTLPLPQRSALLLHVLGDATIEDIAAITGVPPGTIKSRLFTAKRALRVLITEARP
jgi:RNA polymerase sigma-70 factor (ECF subfamily)